MTNETRPMGGQPNEPMVTTKTEQRRVGLIVGAIVAVAVIVAGVVVIVTSLGGDDDTPTEVASTATTDGTGTGTDPATTDRPADPCDTSVLATDLHVDSATAAMCDGTWAVAAAPDGSTVIGKFADDNTWHRVVDTSTTAACRTEILNAGVPLDVVDTAQWSCELTTKPAEWANETAVPIEFGAMGGHVWAAQHVLDIWGLMKFDSSVDGYFGPETLQALVTFQVGLGLEATGAFDQPTIDAMGIDPDTRTASAPILIQTNALNDIYLGSSVDGTIAVLSKILGPPDAYYTPEFFVAFGSCPDYRIVTWSGLTIYFTPNSNGSYAFSSWTYRTGPDAGPDLQIRAGDGRTVGVALDQTSPEPTMVMMDGDTGYALYQWPDGVMAVVADGTIQSMRGGDPACFAGLE